MTVKRSRQLKPRLQARPYGLAAKCAMIILPVVITGTLFIGEASASWLSDVTGVNVDLNREFGSGVSQIAGPTFDRAEKVGHALIDESDKVMKERLAQLDLIAQNNLGRVDTMLERRLSQVDEIAARRLDQIDQIADRQISRVDTVMSNQLQEANRVVGQRLVDVEGLTAKAIADLDGRLAQRIVQIDEVASRQIMTAEILVTTGTLNFEATVRRIIMIACILVFLSASLWRLYVLALKPEQVNSLEMRPVLQALRKRWKPLLPQLVLACAGALGIYVVYLILPGSPAQELKKLEAIHSAGLEASIEQFDLSAARSYAAQLRLLAPAEGKYSALLRKAELIADVLRTPSFDKTTVENIDFRLASTARALGQADDPDLLALAAMVLWRSGKGRLEELAAATAAAKAIEASEKRFPLLPLAIMYLDNYLSDPIPKELLHAAEVDSAYSEQRLRDIRSRAEQLTTNQTEPVQVARSTFQLNLKLRTALASSRHEYSNLLKRIAERDSVGVASSATSITETWKALDANLEESGLVDGRPESLALFRLPDSVYSRACWYGIYSSSGALQASSELSGNATVRSAVSCAPPRVLWAKRYLTSFSRETATLAMLQEAQRAVSLDAELVRAESWAQSFYRELAGERRATRLLESGEATSTYLAKAGLAQASVEVLRELERNTPPTEKEAIGKIAKKVSAAFLGTRSPLV